MRKTKFKMNILTCLVIATAVVSITMVVKGFMLQPIVSANYEKAGTDEYIEKIAREKLGMIKSDEIVFIDISGQ